MNLNNEVYIVCVTDEFLPTPVNTTNSNKTPNYNEPFFFDNKKKAENEAKRLNRLSGIPKSDRQPYYVVPLKIFKPSNNDE